MILLHISFVFLMLSILMIQEAKGRYCQWHMECPIGRRCCSSNACCSKAEYDVEVKEKFHRTETQIIIISVCIPVGVIGMCCFCWFCCKKKRSPTTQNNGGNQTGQIPTISLALDLENPEVNYFDDEPPEYGSWYSEDGEDKTGTDLIPMFILPDYDSLQRTTESSNAGVESAET
ncbi:uncharacterized protein LOC120338211 isoform X1 [Styela clava]|uniref:uncharacterized protein LOC120338211 isoform X1 n=2 Tax=Styela clava TaxID=7725 RepID=UPI00193AB3A8|nr:uncharacterized protein LOC120338211 isoform X1 [Styela clava]